VFSSTSPLPHQPSRIREGSPASTGTLTPRIQAGELLELVC
jgi:hypothetical protein